jgi:hypothetical protein
MPLPGGETDKIGNRYEGRWTALCMIDVMDEKANAIRLEKPGEDAFEFFVYRDDKVECHQVKRQRSGRGRWTLKALEDQQVQVLSDFWHVLDNSEDYCVFVSTQDADELGELANRARSAVSWEEFEREYLNKTQNGHFTTLREKWKNCSPQQAYEALKRVRVETVGEDFLVSTIESRIVALVEGDPKTIRLELAELALERIHQELTTYDIWRYLSEERGYRRREWAKDQHILAAVEDVNNRYLSPLRELDFTYNLIPRDEAQTVFEFLHEKKKSVLLVGEAGVGKTGVMLQAIEKLQQNDLPVLAFRVDRIKPSTLPDELGRQIGLPGSPAIVLANIAQKRNCVLVIDQLDAVSIVSGRNPEFFDCIFEIIKQAQAHPNIQVLLACRRFDSENDFRFKRLTGEKGIAQPVVVNRLAASTVKEIVAELGVDLAQLSEKQVDLLTVPLHLTLFTQIAENATIDAFSFETAKDLFDKFWEHKQLKLKERLGHSVHWTQVIDVLCDYMNSQYEQILSAPERVIDDYVDDARAMASEHILTWENKRVSFFHEGFFDYAFARRFANRNQNLMSFLRSSEQHLFRRAQVRQILLHEREDNFTQYLKDLNELLTSPDIRFHLKQVILVLLAALSNPTVEEWEVIAPLINESSDALTQQIWQMLRSSVQWFHLLNSLEVIEQWLHGQDDELIDQAITLLSILQDQAPTEVARLIEPFIESREQIWQERWKRFFRLSENTERPIFNIFLQLIEQGLFNQPSQLLGDSQDFWFQIYSLTKIKANWACQAIGSYLNQLLDVMIETNQLDHISPYSDILPESRFDDSVLLEASENNPTAFVEYVLPFVLRIVEVTANSQDEMPYLDNVWHEKNCGEGHRTSDKLLHFLENSLSKVAATSPEELSETIKQLLSKSDFETAQYLLIRTYAANGEKFANDAVDYLCEKPYRLKTGYSICNGNSLAARYWATHQMLEAITPYCSAEKLRELETLLLSYYPPANKYPDRQYMILRLKLYGYQQFVLLDAIASNRRSNAAHRRLQEWRRKFISAELLEASGIIEPPMSIEARTVGSPIQEDAASKMSDQQWLEALQKYNDDKDGRRFRQGGEYTGGAWALSSVLEHQTKKDPIRFSKLTQQFPDTFDSCYFDAVLRGVAEVGVDVETATNLCQRCDKLPHKPCGQSISWLVRKLAHLSWSEDIYSIVVHHATQDLDPKQDRNTRTLNQRDLESLALNSVRGSAVAAIADLIFSDKNRTAYFQPFLPQIVRDPSNAVRSYAAEVLTAVLNSDHDLAVHLFFELCDADEIILGTRTVEKFLRYALHSHFDLLEPTIKRMLHSEISEVIEVGAKKSCDGLDCRTSQATS